MNQQFFPYPGADGFKSSFVRSTTSAETAQVRDFFCYERPTLRFKPVAQNPGGAFNARVAAFDATGYTAVALLYTKAAGGAVVALGTTPVMNWDAGGGFFDGTLNLNTEQAIAATAALAGGGSLAARFAFILYGGGGEPFIVEQAVRLFFALPPDNLPDPENVTACLLANLLASVLAASDTVTWEQVDCTQLAHVPLFGAPGILAPLAITYTKPNLLDPTVVPASNEVSATVGGVPGERYLIRARFSGNVEIKSYAFGYEKPGDDPHVKRGGTNGGETATDEWYLDISSPAQRIYLNQGFNAPVTPVDHAVRFLADAGATVTLGFDSGNGGSSAAGNGTLVFESAAEIVGSLGLTGTASAHTGVALTGTRSDVVTGNGKETLRLPVAMSLGSVFASLTVASTAGLTTVDINKNGVSILATKLTIDAGEKSSLTAAAAAVLADTVISPSDEITFDVDTAGTGAKGLKVWLVGDA